MVGTLGFFVDALVLTLLIGPVGVGLYLGRLGSFLAAATFTWACNRRFTFGDTSRSGRFRQWGRFLAANAAGGLVNYGLYAALVTWHDGFRSWPVLAVAAGSLAGLLVNFFASRRFVFRSA